jgi:hypothetical protein
MRRLDQWLIECVFEPISFRLEWWLGVTNFMIARLMVVVWAAAIGAHAMEANTWYWWVLAVLTIMVVPFRFLDLWMLERDAQRVGLASRERYRWPGFRYIQLLLIIAATPILLWEMRLRPSDVAGFAFLFQLYFACCSVPPPSPSQLVPQPSGTS